MKTLSLFNAVVAKAPKSKSNTVDLEFGLVIDSSADWAHSHIVKYYRDQKLSGNDLNKSFHKSFQKVQSSSRAELLADQIRHYCSTYGTNFEGEIYIPDEILEIPEAKLSFRVVRGLTKEEIISKCLTMLGGVALKEETIDDILSVLDEVGYKFTGKENIKNREAIIKIADLHGIMPADTTELFRYCIYKATGKSLLIKNAASIQAIKSSEFDPSSIFQKHGVDNLGKIFNRFKPLFLAFKKKCPHTINVIARYSKVNHKPLVSNPLNQVTNKRLSEKDLHWLDNATPFAFFKALAAIHSRMQGQTSFCYRIRNGKSWVGENTSANLDLLASNFSMLMDYAKKRWDMSGVNIFIPEGVEYAVPTSEKMFVGNIPAGTKFHGEKLAIGVYWENSWGARDIDLSCTDINNHKIGWNSRYSTKDVIYSGDITYAPNGAVEYLHFQNVFGPKIVNINIFRGSDTTGYKIVVGSGDEISKPYMMDPNKVMAEIKTCSVQNQMIFGIVLPEEKGQSFVLINCGSGQAKVSRNSNGLQALYEQYETPLNFKTLVKHLGANIVDSPDRGLDLSVNKIDKSTFINLFGT
jgi:hypothetical protein